MNFIYIPSITTTTNDNLQLNVVFIVESMYSTERAPLDFFNSNHYKRKKYKIEKYVLSSNSYNVFT